MSSEITNEAIGSDADDESQNTDYPQQAARISSSSTAALVQGVAPQVQGNDRRTNFADLPNELRLEIFEMAWCSMGLHTSPNAPLVRVAGSNVVSFFVDTEETAERKANHCRLHALSMASRRVHHEFLDWYVPKTCETTVFTIRDTTHDGLGLHQLRRPSSKPIPTFQTTIDFLSGIPTLNTAFDKPLPIVIDIEVCRYYEFNGEKHLHQSLQNIPGTDVLVPGSLIRVSCTVHEDGVHTECFKQERAYIDRDEEHTAFSAQFLFRVRDEGIEFGQCLHHTIQYW